MIRIFKILASLLYNWLLTKENFKETAFLTQTTCDKINAFAELLWHIIYNLTYGNLKLFIDIMFVSCRLF